MSNCLISCGNCSTLYLYIVYRIIFKGLKDLILIDKIEIQLKNHTLFMSIYKYLGFILFGFLFYTIKSRDKKNKIKIENVAQKFNTELIHYQRRNVSNFSIFRLMITCILYALFLEFIVISYFLGFHDLDFWIFNIAFALLFLSKYYSINLYKHHLYSLGFIFFTNLIILIIKSILDGNDNDKNVYEKVEEIFHHKGFSVLIIFLFILNSLSISFTRVSTKVFMEIKYISYYRIIFFIGAFGLILSSFLLIILSIFFSDCKIGQIYGKDIDNFLKYFQDINNIWLEILFTLLYLFISFMEFYYEILIIYYLNPIYFLISDSLYYGLKSIFEDIQEQSFNLKNKLSILADIFAFIGYSIYVEAIILNFCGLNKNTKINITQRGILEIKNMEQICEDEEEEDEEDNDNDKKR